MHSEWKECKKKTEQSFQKIPKNDILFAKLLFPKPYLPYLSITVYLWIDIDGLEGRVGSTLITGFYTGFLVKHWSCYTGIQSPSQRRGVVFK